MMKKYHIIGLVIAVVLIAGIVYADQMTFSTYYPAPYGRYRQFSTTGLTTLATDEFGNEGATALVGIGTTNPNVPLTIIEDSTTTIYQMHIGNADSTAELYLGVVGSSSPTVGIENDAIITNAGNSDLIFSTGNQEVMRLQDGGNVGIGTVDPGTNKLEVVGGPVKTTGGLIIETRTSTPASPVDGQIWLRTDVSP